ncbi:hypothetical protein [Pseudomonas asiatica]|uniref:hypothetical protein n=1 Tax=Pseudomonas asiatica TaxID=2219225 RepID=UPI0018AB7FD0|nr:hypothetical protein [Pseudomonas asiatica]MBF8806198.1 hypothetical protein [Pseudomonas asiatica]MBH3377112.1 hypothetical protein [Pseudomonas asiatica]MDD1982399.1 hypothetical protein [Pseudomonas asiatica]MDH0131782.1 hypothetical protein [Pseudomonas asiatica]
MKYRGRLSDEQFEAFMTRYFPTFMGGSLLCMLAGGGGISMWQHGYLRGVSDSQTYALAALLTLCFLICVGQIALIRGFRWGVWLVLPSLLGPAIAAVGLFGTRYAGAVQMSVLFMSLAGLLVLNSNKHRAMRKRLEEMRLQRNGAMPATRSDEFPDGPPSEKPWMAYLVLGTMTIIILCKIYLFFWG